MKVKIRSVFCHDFERFGKVIKGYDVGALLAALESSTPRPEAGTVYVPGAPELESLPLCEELSNGVYGGLPVQIGYCNGTNTRLNCLEYHRGSELNIPANDMVLLLAPLHKVKNGQLNTCHVEAFRVPKGTVVQVYETTLHYAPCTDVLHDGTVSPCGFRVAIVLPKGTNTEKPPLVPRNTEDRMLWAKNKWLIAHPESAEAKQGAFVGLTGENIDISR